MSAGVWAPDLAERRLLHDGRSSAFLRPDGTIDWWCAPVDAAPVLWQLLDPDGAAARFTGLTALQADDGPAAVISRTVLQDKAGTVEVRDGLLAVGGGSALVRLVRRLEPVVHPVEHVLHLGGLGSPAVPLAVDGETALGKHAGRPVRVRGGEHAWRDGRLHTRLPLTGTDWHVLVVQVGEGELPLRPRALLQRLLQAQAREDRRAGNARLPRKHPQRAADSLAVLRACTYAETGAVVASPTTSLPEAPGHDRQFDYRYCWLRDASLSTAVAGLLGQDDDARRYLSFVHQAWGTTALRDRPVLTVRGDEVPDEQEVGGIDGWAGSRPVRMGNGAAGQRQFDAPGLLVEAVSVHLQCGGALDDATWELVRRLADEVAEEAEQVVPSNGIWELREQAPLLDGDIGRWLVVDRALWIARGWRPTTRRRHWRRARQVLGDRVRGAFHDGRLPQRYDDDDAARPDASALLAVAFGLFHRRDRRAGLLVDDLLARLGDGPYLYRYPPDAADGFSGREGAFLPVSFLAVTALAVLGRLDEAEQRLDALCASLPRLLSEEVDPTTHRLLGNTPLVWSHAELARALYVLDAARRREQGGLAVLWAWRLQRYLALRLRARPDPGAPP